MIDILADARKWIAEEGIGERMGRTHGEECHRWHLTCLVSRLADEVESLRKKDESPSRLSVVDTLQAERITQALAADRFAAAVQEADTLRARVAELEAQVADCNILLGDRWREAVSAVTGESAPAASGAAGTEPDYYVYKNERGRIVYTSQKLVGDEWAAWTITPLYAAPQPARGWLTEEQRSMLLSMADDYERRATEIEKISQPGMTIGSGLPKASDCRSDAAMLRSILARSSPPEVVLEDFPPDAIRSLDKKYLAGWDQCMALAKRAISAAGVTVKEVGREL